MSDFRQQLVDRLNQSNLASHLTKLRMALTENILTQMNRSFGEPQEPTQKQRIELLLNLAGPAMAASVMQESVESCLRAGKLQSVSGQLNGSITHNLEVIYTQNDDSGYFGSHVIQSLLPRSAFIDFDAMVDPRHKISIECGYPKWISPAMYRFMYDRDDMASRVVNIFPDETWAYECTLVDSDNDRRESPLEKKWDELCEHRQLLAHLHRLDRVQGIGSFGVMLIGTDDEDANDFSKPVRGFVSYDDMLAGRASPPPSRNLLYLRSFDEYLCYVRKIESDPTNPRYGMPTEYTLIFIDMKASSAGFSGTTRSMHNVHWTRLIHAADNLDTSLCFGIPRQQQVFDRLLDLRKVKGSSAEMFYKGAFPGYTFEVDPRYGPDEIEINKEESKQAIREWMDGLDRSLDIIGLSAKSLAPQVSDPSKHVAIQEGAIATAIGVPLRFLKGSEEGRLASSTDRQSMNQRIGRRIRTNTNPNLVLTTVRRLMEIGILPFSPNARSKWPDLNSASDEDKANLSLKWTQSLSQYVATGMIHLIEPMSYLTMILGLRPADAIRIVEAMNKEGGLSKLKAVDPSQGSGVNGKRENIADGSDGDSRSKRDTADKKAENNTN